MQKSDSTPEPHTTVEVQDISLCQFRHTEPTLATVDGKTTMGPWAFMCDAHHNQYGVGLGEGKGQRLIVRPVC